MILLTNNTTKPLLLPKSVASFFWRSRHLAWIMNALLKSWSYSRLFIFCPGLIGPLSARNCLTSLRFILFCVALIFWLLRRLLCLWHMNRNTTLYYQVKLITLVSISYHIHSVTMVLILHLLQQSNQLGVGYIHFCKILHAISDVV